MLLLFAFKSYRCNMMASVIMQINKLLVEVQHIPGGCTGVCQHLDVRVAEAL